MSIAADPSRVYIGNVDYNATEDELRELFQDFKVVSVEIPHKTITRGEKSYERRLGFGFVQFANETEAENAISEFNGKKFKLRQIYAKQALPPATEEEKQKRKELSLARQAKLKDQKKEAAHKAAAGSEAARSEAVKPPSAKAPAATHVTKTPEGKKSTDTVFVTNLDYKANVKSLSELFKDLSPIWVNVPTKRRPFHVFKKHNSKNKKGIAFVKFTDEETQLRAITEFNGRELNGKNIVVEVAIDKAVSSETSSSESTKSPAAAGAGESADSS